MNMNRQELSDEHKREIDAMSHEDMARLWRFGPAGHHLFERRSAQFNYFMDRFNSFGGMTPEMSKKIGW